MGASGSGKTTALPSFAKKGVEVFVITTEPGGVDSLIDGAKLHGVPIDKIHWASCLPQTEGWEALTTMTSDISGKDFEGISKIKGIGKDKTRASAMKLLDTLKNFTCERTGQQYGDFTKLGPNQALAIDSLSGLSVMAWYLTVGYKPTGAPGEWNIAMNWIEALIMKINSDRRCFFTMTAHVEKEMDETSGVNKLMVSTLGRKLAPKVPRFFGEVIYSTRSVSQKGEPAFNWSNIDAQIELKNRALPVSQKLLPDFSQVVDGYHRRLKEAGLGTPV